MNMSFPLYARVRLITDKYLAEGVGNGAIGYIIEKYKDAYEVEFSDAQGITIAQIAVSPNEIILHEPSN